MDYDSGISVQEFIECISEFEPKLSIDDATARFKVCDVTNTNTCKTKEFLDFCISAFDVDGISAEEFMDCIHRLDSDCSETEKKLFFERCDVDKNELCSETEFTNFCISQFGRSRKVVIKFVSVKVRSLICVIFMHDYTG